jgi:hypothetical protein
LWVLGHIKCACLLKRYCDLMVRHWRTFCSRIPAVKPLSVTWRHSPSIFLLFLDSHQHGIWIVSRCTSRQFSCIFMQHPSLLDAHDVAQRGHESTAAISTPLVISRLVGEVSRSHYWCASGSVQRLCVPNTSRAERFPEVVQRYARMTDRLIKALQSTGVLTNGADAAQIASSFGMPTTAKTIVRRVLQLPLPSEGSVHKVSVDEWAWKKRMDASFVPSSADALQ